MERFFMKPVRVHYSTAKHSQPITAHEASFASLADAMNALPTGNATALIFVDGGSYFYDGRYRGFGWQFLRKAALVTVPV